MGFSNCCLNKGNNILNILLVMVASVCKTVSCIRKWGNNIKLLKRITQIVLEFKSVSKFLDIPSSRV